MFSFSSESDTNQLSEEIERLQSQNDALKDQLEKSSINVSSSNVSFFKLFFFAEIYVFLQTAFSSKFWIKFSFSDFDRRFRFTR